MTSQLLDFPTDADDAVEVATWKEDALQLLRVGLVADNAELVGDLTERNLRELGQIYWEPRRVMSMLAIRSLSIAVRAVADMNVDLEVRGQDVHAAELLAASLDSLGQIDCLCHGIAIGTSLNSRWLLFLHL